MSAEVVGFRPCQSAIDAAWEAYDAAQLRAHALYAEPSASTSAERLAAVTEAIERQIAFVRLYERGMR